MNCPYYTTEKHRNQHFFAILAVKNATPAFCTNFSFLSSALLVISYNTLEWGKNFGGFCAFSACFSPGSFREFRAISCMTPAIRPALPGFIYICIQCVYIFEFLAAKSCIFPFRVLQFPPRSPSGNRKTGAPPGAHPFFFTVFPPETPSERQNRRSANGKCPSLQRGAGSR